MPFPHRVWKTRSSLRIRRRKSTSSLPGRVCRRSACSSRANSMAFGAPQISAGLWTASCSSTVRYLDFIHRCRRCLHTTLHLRCCSHYAYFHHISYSYFLSILWALGPCGSTDGRKGDSASGFRRDGDCHGIANHSSTGVLRQIIQAIIQANRAFSV